MKALALDDNHTIESAAAYLKSQGYTHLVTRGKPADIALSTYRKDDDSDTYCLVVCVFGRAIIAYARSYQTLARQAMTYAPLLFLTQEGDIRGLFSLHQDMA